MKTLITTQEAARLLGISEKTLRRYEQIGIVPPAHRITARVVRWDKDELLEKCGDIIAAKGERQ